MSAILREIMILIPFCPVAAALVLAVTGAYVGD